MSKTDRTPSLLGEYGLKPIMIPFVGLFYVPMWMYVHPFFEPD